MLNPWTDVEAAFAEFDALAQALMGRGMDGRHGLRQLVWRPTTPHLAKSDKGWTLTADVPGLAADGLSLTVHEGKLELSAERAPMALPEGQTLLHRERQGWRLSRTVRLPDVVDVDGIEAQLTDGVLTVTLPTRADAGPRSIPVRGL